MVQDLKLHTKIPIVKNSHLGVETWRYMGELVGMSQNAYLFEAFFNRKDLLFNGVSLRTDDRFLELYPLEKWFNIFEIHDVDDDHIKAWYCNITRPIQVQKNRIEYDDLALDLLVYPDGTIKELDWDEFQALSLPLEERDQALQGISQLKEIFSRICCFDVRRFSDFL